MERPGTYGRKLKQRFVTTKDQHGLDFRVSVLTQPIARRQDLDGSKVLQVFEPETIKSLMSFDHAEGDLNIESTSQNQRLEER